MAGWIFSQDATPPEGAERGDDPFSDGLGRSGSDISPQRTEQETAGIEIRLEIYDLPVLKVIQLLDEKESEGQLRKDVLAEVEAGKRTNCRSDSDADRGGAHCHHGRDM